LFFMSTPEVRRTRFSAPLIEIAQTGCGSGHGKPRLAVGRRVIYAKYRHFNGLKAAMASPPDVTALLAEWSRGEHRALNQLLPLVYAELRRIAARQLRNERAGHTLQPTALVHEVYLRLVDQRNVDWQNRAHFFGVAAQVMRRILVDHARRHKAGKRGEGLPRVSMEEAKEVAAPDGIPVLALDQALDRLAGMDAELARIVELRAFGGLTIEEAACVLKMSPTTAKREWRTAKAWLTRELGLEIQP
jgi:RNA polymerase sigma factor (TIGR02999 family)